MSSRPCKTEGCQGQATASKTPYCNPCRYQRELERDPERVAYYKLKSRAKKRRVPFLLTLHQFREFCTQHTYMADKGRTSQGYHIDRMDESKGYYLGNLQVLTNAQNITKSNNYRRYRRLLTRWLEMGGTGPVPEFIAPATLVPQYEYYRGKLVSFHLARYDNLAPPTEAPVDEDTPPF